MDRWMVLRRQQMLKRARPAAPPPASEPIDRMPEEAPGDERAWIRNALWIVAGYLLLRLIERGLRYERPGQARRSVRA